VNVNPRSALGHLCSVGKYRHGRRFSAKSPDHLDTNPAVQTRGNALPHPAKTPLFPGTFDDATVSGNTLCVMEAIPANKATTRRVQQHRARTGLIRVEVEVPTSDDALAVRRFAQARRRAREPPRPLELPPPTATPPDIAATLAAMDEEKREISLLFVQALMQTAAPDMLARGRRVALNFADAVSQRCSDMALADHGRT